MTILMIAMSEMNDDLGDDITFLEPGILIGAFTRVVKTSPSISPNLTSSRKPGSRKAA
ncbi:hypothetical protein IAG41_15360 [Sphingomonas sp. JC676]|uniref:hypothetical protein n=1 Tax=Sphingomonas sp. JC676 TaxID=2768065 RepID=UPI0016577FD8|nr:hypothetical protein [Sphingomonas sp. JC676]MBC9033773.1 hypothetical protein [Sphingomonas sp. JC676]